MVINGMIKVNIIILLFFGFISCNQRPTRSTENVGNQNNKAQMDQLYPDIEYDSVKYYKDFDWINFKGRQNVYSDSKEYPYIKMSYKADSILMKIYFTEKDIEERRFFKKDEVWVNLMQTKHKREGEYHYYLTLFQPENCIQIEYTKNPFRDIDNEMFEISFFESSENKISQTGYIVASRGIKGLLPIKNLTQVFGKQNCFFMKVNQVRIEDKKAISITKEYSHDNFKKSIFSNEKSPFVEDFNQYYSYFYYRIKQEKKYLINVD